MKRPLKPIKTHFPSDLAGRKHRGTADAAGLGVLELDDGAQDEHGGVGKVLEGASVRLMQ